MKRERPLTVYDCARTTRAIANAQGKIVFLWQDDIKKPRRSGRGIENRKGETTMPGWIVKPLLAAVFGVPLVIGVFALVFGDVWLGYMDKKEERNGNAQCNGRG